MKAWKIVQIVGVLLLLLGVVMLVGTVEMYGTALIMVGAIAFAVGRVGVWLKSDRP
jgi:hypothetical protein